MRNREYFDPVREFLKYDLVRKPSDGKSPGVPSHEFVPFACRREPLDLFKSSEDFCDEPVGDSSVSLAIPSRAFAEFLTRGGLKAYRFQR